MTHETTQDGREQGALSLADTAAAVAESQSAQALCEGGAQLCPPPGEGGYRCKALAGVKRVDSFDTLRDNIATYMTADDVAKLERAYLFARKAH